MKSQREADARARLEDYERARTPEISLAVLSFRSQGVQVPEIRLNINADGGGVAYKRDPQRGTPVVARISGGRS
jgi:hypothetical protein